MDANKQQKSEKKYTLLSRYAWGAYFLVLSAIGLYLFGGFSFDFFEQKINLHGSNQSLTIGYALAPKSLEPTLFDPVTRSYLTDVYQGLVKTDASLKLQPAIAVSWGLIDPLTWEFTLRPGVKFHNGEIVKPEDVVSSIEYAKSEKNSQLKILLSTIRSIKVVNQQKVHIHTSVSDPLLINKLAFTYIFPQKLQNFEHPVGTGPYRIRTKSKTTIVLDAFPEYYGEKPFYHTVHLKNIPGSQDRITALENGEIQLLANLPPSAACPILKIQKKEDCQSFNRNISLKATPGLEVSFLIFNTSHPLFQQQEIRSALGKAIDRKVFEDISLGFARSSNQFVSNGIFGFNPELKSVSYNLQEAKKEVQKFLENSPVKTEFTFDYPKGLDQIGKYIQKQAEEIGLKINLNPLSQAELQNKIFQGKSDFYFLGWRSELGDAADFLTSVAHSRDTVLQYGQFNGSHYVNKKVDQLIAQSITKQDTKARLEALQEAMKIIVEEDILGIPLYETEIIYGFSKSIDFEPRVDGYIYPSEIH